MAKKAVKQGVNHSLYCLQTWKNWYAWQELNLQPSA